VMSLTTMNVHNVSVRSINQLKKLTAKLFCKKNTWSNHNKSLTLLGHFHVGDCVFNHTNGLATTSRNNNSAFLMLQHSVRSVLLMGTQGDSQVLSCSV